MIKFRDATPEEKLLHIIEKPEEVDRLKMHKRKGSFSLKSRSPAAILGRIDFKKIGLHGINKSLTWLSIIITLALIIYFVRGERLVQTRLASLKEKDLEESSFQAGKKQKIIPEFSAYISTTEKNNPFHVLPVVSSPEAEETEKKMDLTLVGIIWSSKPQAIIEDTVSKKNFLVYEGDMVDKFKIIDITQTEVKLGSEDGEKILR